MRSKRCPIPRAGEGRPWPPAGMKHANFWPPRVSPPMHDCAEVLPPPTPKLMQEMYQHTLRALHRSQSRGRAPSLQSRPWAGEILGGQEFRQPRWWRWCGACTQRSTPLHCGCNHPVTLAAQRNELAHPAAHEPAKWGLSRPDILPHKISKFSGAVKSNGSSLGQGLFPRARH